MMQEERPRHDVLAEDVGEGRLAALREGLLGWYAVHRRDLPWRRTRDPYHILVSEMMLQQTQVPRVLPRYRAWLERFPTLAALAAAPTAEVLRAWSGLGYNSRAVRLQTVARQVVARHGGRMPETVEGLLALPGIGDYTARAVACFAYGRDVPVLDTNVKRVLHRVLLGAETPRPLATDRQLWALAERAVPPGRGYDWNQALMDFGSAICTARKPACVVCPLRPACRAAPTIQAALAERQGARRGGAADRAPATPFTSTARHYRGQTLRVLGALTGPEHEEGLALDALGPRVKPGYTDAERAWLYDLVRGLDRDGLVSLRRAGHNGPGAAGDRGRERQAAAVREAGARYAAGEIAASTPPAEPDPDLASVRVSLPHG
jgi:A/G-specific adenine glycosylase